MYFSDHQPPHFHAVYGEHEALIAIEALEVIRGSLPRRAVALVLEWALLHREELQRHWVRVRTGQPLQAIEPLD